MHRHFPYLLAPREAWGRHRSAFTLIELLAVLVVIGILMAIVIPAVTGIGRGTSMQAAISNLRSTISFARQAAITRRKTVYIVLPDAGIGNSPDEFQASLAARSFAVYEVFDDETGEGQYLTDWNVLPSGIVFYIDPTGPNSAFTAAKRRVSRFPFTDSASAVHQFNVIRFRPNGTLLVVPPPIGVGGAEGFLFLRPGSLAPQGNTPDDLDYVGTNRVALKVHQHTGAMRVEFQE